MESSSKFKQSTSSTFLILPFRVSQTCCGHGGVLHLVPSMAELISWYLCHMFSAWKTWEVKPQKMSDLSETWDIFEVQIFEQTANPPRVPHTLGCSSSEPGDRGPMSQLMEVRIPGQPLMSPTLPPKSYNNPAVYGSGTSTIYRFWCVFLIETLENTMFVVPIVSNVVLYFPKCHTVMAVYQFLIVI